jgi:hypothetical protein
VLIYTVAYCRHILASTEKIYERVTLPYVIPCFWVVFAPITLNLAIASYTTVHANRISQIIILHPRVWIEISPP